MKANKRKILAISGSTRKNSSNIHLIHAIEKLSADTFEITIFDGIAGLPHFNPDLDTENPPREIADFRNVLRNSEGILICTPEYAMGVPGSLKNAIDWTVSSMEFSAKPTALITASSLGDKGHQSLMETLKIIEAGVYPDTQLLISHVKTKVNGSAEITDPFTLSEIQKLLQAFANKIELSTQPKS